MKAILAIPTFSLLLAACNNNSVEQKEEAEAPHDVKQYGIEQFYKSSEVFGGNISDDDKTMLITTNETGIYNTFEIDIASGEKKALTNSAKESIFANSYVPFSKNIIYNSDKGGNEISHLYLLKTDGSLKDLTSANNEKASFWGWTHDSKNLYYSSNKRDSKFLISIKWIRLNGIL